MRGHLRRLVVGSTAALVAGLLVLVPISVLLLGIHGSLWRLDVTAPGWLTLLLLVAASPLMAVPGCLASYVVRQPRGHRWAAATASAAGGLAGALLTTSMLGVWAGMTWMSLLAVAWRGPSEHPLPDRRGNVDRVSGWTAVELEDLEVRVPAPRSRLVPREVMAPPEGWDVPEGLPEHRVGPRGDRSARPDR